MRLCVNVDHVATLRQARKTVAPDPLEAALLAVKSGAHGITIHLREDRRHIQDRDLQRMRDGINSKLNLEMAIAEEIIKIALDKRPDQVTFVPEKREEITTEGGLDVTAYEDEIRRAVLRFKEAGIPVSLFIDATPRQVEAAARIGAYGIEINTGRYSECLDSQNEEKEFNLIQEAALIGKKNGLKIYAGHGLNYKNTKRIVSISEIEELNIGHSIVARAVMVGMEIAVKEMSELLIA